LVKKVSKKVVIDLQRSQRSEETKFSGKSSTELILVKRSFSREKRRKKKEKKSEFFYFIYFFNVATHK